MMQVQSTKYTERLSDDLLMALLQSGPVPAGGQLVV